MQIETHDYLKQPRKHHATRAVIYDDFGNPLAFAVQLSPGHIRIFRVEDPDFADQLSVHGIDRTVVIKMIETG